MSGELTTHAGLNKVECSPGDILQNLDLSSPWQYFICYKESYDRGKSWEAVVRCENAHNVGQDQVAEVRNLGHYSKNPGILGEQDVEEFKEQGI